MTVVSRPAERHACRPGVTPAPVVMEGREVPGLHYSIVPDRYRYPPGTVWACPCGRTWVAYRPQGADQAGMIGRIWWRRESRWARWRRRHEEGGRP